MAKVGKEGGSQCDMLLKIIIIGDSGVGKSNILMKFSDSEFKTNYTPTIGVDFKIKSLTMQGKRIKFQIWDTAGQERYRTITQTYYKGAHGVILAYSVTDRKSFESVEGWMKQVQEHSSAGVKVILIGNKSDLKEERKVQFEQGKSLAIKFDIPFAEVSAKMGDNVTESFTELGELILSDITTNEDKYQNTKLNEQADTNTLKKNSVKTQCKC